MNSQAKKTQENISQSIANDVTKVQSDGDSSFQFMDNRSDAIAQRKLQVMANNSTHNTPISFELVQMPNNQPVQRLVGAEGSSQEGKAVNFTLHQDFIDKHVANDEAEAVSVTEKRVASGKPKGMAEGKAPNNLAKQADWEKAIEDSKEVVPPENEWGNENNLWDDDEQFINSLARVEVDGWEAIGTKDNVKAKQVTNKKYVGGTWSVKNSKVDESGIHTDGTGDVSMEIEHLTSNI